MAEAGGLAGKVRGSTESDQFDLGGKSQAQLQEIAKAAFEEPLTLREMIRISFVVGAGKLGRQKYSDDLPRHMCDALRAVGYEEDNSADVSLSSAGKFKFQHDTGKNLKFVHVFPRVAPPEAAGGEEEEEEGGATPAAESPLEILVRCSAKDFERLLEAQIKTYSAQRRLLAELKARVTQLEETERKMIARESLTPAEQSLYDTVSADDLKDKAKSVTQELQGMVDGGRLTAKEKEAVVTQLDEKLRALGVELQKAESDGKAKLQAKLEEQQEKLKATRATAAAAAPAAPTPLKHGAQIVKLKKKLAQIDRIEKASSGHYTMDELKLLGERPELEEAIGVLEERSRDWLESDEEFQERLRACLRAVAASKAKGGPSAEKASAGSGFTTVKKKR